MNATFQPRRFSADEFQRMIAADIFGEDDRLELLEGDIIKMAPIGPRHAGCVIRLTTVLGRIIGGHALLSVQNPVRLDDQTELYPGIVLLKPRADSYLDSSPGPQDVLLLIEVAYTTLKIDRSVKVPRYGRAGIPEVWLLDLDSKQIYVYTDPGPSGYRNVRQIRSGELQASQLPVQIKVDAVL